jgi:hypothetical protein
MLLLILLWCTDLDGHISHQAAQKLRYDAFFDYKMRLFWYFCRQYESMIERDPAAKIYFSKVAQATVLRVINDLASVGNEPIGFVELTDEMQGTAGACKNSRHDKCTRLAKTTNDGNVFETRPHISDCPTVEQKPAY